MASQTQSIVTAAVQASRISFERTTIRKVQTRLLLFALPKNSCVHGQAGVDREASVSGQFVATRVKETC